MQGFPRMGSSGRVLGFARFVAVPFHPPTKSGVLPSGFRHLVGTFLG